MKLLCTKICICQYTKILYLILLVLSFLVDLKDGQMNLLLHKSNRVQLTISGSMNSLNCMLVTGQKNLGSRLVKGLSTPRVIVGQMHTMSKSCISCVSISLEYS